MADSIILLEERKEVTTFLLDEGTITATTVTTPTGETPGYEYAGDKIKVGDLTYTVNASSEDTIAKQITALKAVLNVSAITDNYTIGGSSPNCSLTEKSGKYGLTTFPQVVVEIGEGSSGKVSMTETEGTHAGNVIIVTATSVYDDTKFNTATISVA